MAVDLFWPGTDAPYGYIAAKLGLPPPTSSPTTGSIDIDAATADLKKSAAESPVPENAFVGPIDAISSADQAVYSDRSAVPTDTLANKFPHPASASTVTPVTQEQVVGPVTLPGDKVTPHVTVASQDQSQAGASNQAVVTQQIPYTPRIDVLDKQNRYQTLADNTSALTEQGVGLDVAGGELSADELTNAAMLKTEAFKRKEFLRQQEVERQQAIIKRQEAIAAQTEDALAELQRVSKPPARGDYTAAVAMAALAGGSGAEAGARMILGTIEQRIKSRQERWQNEVAGAQTRLSGLNDAINVLNSSGITGKNAFDAQVAIESQRVADQLDLNSSYFAPDKARLAAEMAANLRRVGSQEKIQSIIKDRITEEDKIESNRISAMKKRGSGGGGGGSGFINPNKNSPYKLYTGVDGGDGTQLYSRKKLSETEQKELRGEIANYEDSQFNRAELRSRLRANGLTKSLGSEFNTKWKNLSSTEQKIIEDLYNEMLQNEVKSISGAGASDSERAQIASRMPGFKEVFGGPDPIGRLDAIESRTDDQFTRHVKHFGVDPAAVSYFVKEDRTGRPDQDDDSDGIPNNDDPDFGKQQTVGTSKIIAEGGSVDSPAYRAAKEAEYKEVQAKAKIENAFEVNQAKIETDKAYNGSTINKFNKSELIDLEKKAKDYNTTNSGLFKTETKFAKDINPLADSYNQAVETRNQALKDYEKNPTPEAAAILVIKIENVKKLKERLDSSVNRIKGNIQK